MFGLFVRFTCKDETSAQAYDRLVAETIEAIKTDEPGTLVYASHLVDGQPLQRIFYELYRDKAAFEAHGAAPHTRRYLAERDQYLASTEVDYLTLQTGKGTGGWARRTTSKLLAGICAPGRAAEGSRRPNRAGVSGPRGAWMHRISRACGRVA